MKRLFLLLLAALLTLCACQPTPEQDAVRQKNTNQLIDTVREAEKARSVPTAAPSEPSDSAPPEAQKMPLKASYPARFQMDKAENGLSVHADVPIRVHTEDALPMLRVERMELTDEQRLTLCSRLFGTDKLYQWEYRMTREKAAEMIRTLMQEPTPEEKAEWMSDGNTEEDWAALLERRAAMAKEYQDLYNALPVDAEKAPLPPYDGSAPAPDSLINRNVVDDPWAEDEASRLTVVEFYSASQDRAIEYRLPWDVPEGISMVFWFDKNVGEYGTERIEPEAYNEVHLGAWITAQQAADQVLSIFDGIADFAVADILWANNASTDGEDAGTVGRWAYLVRCTRSFDGASCPFCTELAMDLEHAENFVVPTWKYEYMMAAVSGDGTLISLVWEGAHRVTEVISDSVDLLPYEQIQEIFFKQVQRRFGGSKKESAVEVTTAELGLFRIREQNSMGTGLMVPVWYFTGSYSESGEGYSYQNTYGSGDPLLIINAIDGSIIDPMKGY